MTECATTAQNDDGSSLVYFNCRSTTVTRHGAVTQISPHHLLARRQPRENGVSVVEPNSLKRCAVDGQ